MASIKKRPDGSWRARADRIVGADGKVHEPTKHFRLKKDAERWLDEITAAVVTGQFVDPGAGKLKLGVYADLWLPQQVQLRDGARARYKEVIKLHIKPTFGGLELAKVHRTQVVPWVAELDEDHQPATVHYIHGVLSAILKAAVAESRIPRNVAAGVRLPKIEERQRWYLSHGQVAKLAECAGDGKLVIETLAYTGLRYGELAGLSVKYVNRLRRRLKIAQAVSEVKGRLVFGPPKSGKSRTVPVRKTIAEKLDKQCEGKGPDDLVFTAPRGGPLALTNWRARVWRPAITAAGFDGMRVHDLRHTAASLAVSAGANVKALQRMLGHASAAMTLDVYADLFDDDLDAVADSLDEAVADFLRTQAQTVRLVKQPSGL